MFISKWKLFKTFLFNILEVFSIDKLTVSQTLSCCTIIIGLIIGVFCIFLFLKVSQYWASCAVPPRHQRHSAGVYKTQCLLQDPWRKNLHNQRCPVQRGLCGLRDHMVRPSHEPCTSNLSVSREVYINICEIWKVAESKIRTCAYSLQIHPCRDSARAGMSKSQLFAAFGHVKFGPLSYKNKAIVPLFTSFIHLLVMWFRRGKDIVWRQDQKHDLHLTLLKTKRNGKNTSKDTFLHVEYKS